MPLNPIVEKAILDQLNKALPSLIKTPAEIRPEYKNRKEIIDYLFYFYDQGWVKFTDLSSKDRRDCCDIRITATGIEYFNRLLRTLLRNRKRKNPTPSRHGILISRGRRSR